MRITLSAAQWASLRDHLLRASLEEHIAIAYSEYSEEIVGGAFLAKEIWLAAEPDYEHQSEYRVELTDEALAAVIKRAWDSRLSIVEFHSHPGASSQTCFSPSDIAGLADLVPHIFWRLKGVPYAAVVVGPDAFDALAWRSPLVVEPVDHVEIEGELVEPTGITVQLLARAR